MMVILQRNVQEQLKTLVNTFNNYREGDDYAKTAFWNWYAQVTNAFTYLDKTVNKNVVDTEYTLPYFGDITYSKFISPQYSILRITHFEIDDDNFHKWLHNVKQSMSIHGFNNLPKSSLTIPQDWNKWKTCSNGFTIIWMEDENCHTVYNYAYNGKVVFTTEKNGEIVPITFTWVSDFKQSPQGVWCANAKYYNVEYLLKQDGECIRNGVTSLMPHKERNVSQAEYNHYKRYGLGDNTNRLGQIISETINNYLRNNLLIA